MNWINIARDTLDQGENLTAYTDRQLALMAKHLKGWNLREGKRIWQQQAVFNTQGAHILVFTMSSEAFVPTLNKEYCYV
ncbi:DcrB-related protein [Kosakonia cowanii]|uniref:DcrB-related protein n=1 Tax=Kosakonia cowanii TaxID=208223 RepID=UPI00345BECAD